MNKKLITITTAALTAAIVGLGALPASAHHPEVTGTATCNTSTGKFDLAWTVQSWNPSYAGDVTNSTRGVIPIGTMIGEPQTFAELGVVAGKYDLYVKMHWDNGATGQVTGKVVAGGDCVAIPLKPEPEAQVVTTSGAFDCDSTTVTDTVTTTYVGHILVDNVWVLNPLPSDRAKVETFDRSLTAEESASLDCAVDVPPVVVPPVTPPVVEPPFVDQQLPTLPATVANPAPVAELAYTGSNDVNPLPYLAIGSLLLAAGVFMTTRKKATK